MYTRDPRPHITPYVMAPSAMGLNLGVFWFLPTTHAKTNTKPMGPRSSPIMFDRHAQTAVDAVIYTPDKPRLF